MRLLEVVAALVMPFAPCQHNSCYVNLALRPGIRRVRRSRRIARSREYTLLHNSSYATLSKRHAKRRNHEFVHVTCSAPFWGARGTKCTAPLFVHLVVLGRFFVAWNNRKVQFSPIERA